MSVEIKVADLLIADQYSVQPELKLNIATTDETRPPSAQLLQDTDVVRSACQFKFIRSAQFNSVGSS